jgi:type VI secretion system protein ImpH
MGTDERAAAGALIDRLLGRPQGFNLFQAISLLERAAPHADPVGEGTDRPEAVRLSAVVSFGFQPSDVASVAEGAATGEAYTLRSPVMTLAGGEGPLPVPYTEMVLERRARRDHATADFLDIFNHRLLAFLYRGRKKHHMGLNWRSPESSAIASTLDALSALGLASGARGEHGETAWLRHAGLLGAAPRSLTGLFAMLGDRLGLRVNGSQFHGAWTNISEHDQARLATRGAMRTFAPRLGRNATLGQRAWYQGAGIRLQLSGLTLSRLRQFLPGARDHALLRWLVNRYVQQEVQVELVLAPAVREVRRAQLGAAGEMRLGWTSWLASGASGAGGQGTPPAPARLRLGPHAAAATP